MNIAHTIGAPVLDARTGGALPKGTRLLGALAASMHIAEAEHIDSADAMDEYRRHLDAQTYQRIAQDHGIRYDSAAHKRYDAQIDDARRADAGMPAGTTLFGPRELEHRHSRELEEKFRPMSGFSQFRVSNEVPVGATTHSVKRWLEDGEAVVYRGGANTGRVGLAQVEEAFPVRHYVTSIPINHFDRLSANFANVAMDARMQRTARRVLERFANTKIWDGDDTNGIYGIKNYPWLARKIATTRFDGSATAAAMLTKLNDAANYPVQESGGAMRPNRAVSSIRVSQLVNQTRLGTVDATTLGEFWLKGQPDINAFEGVDELKDFGGTGIDGILFYDDSEDGVTNEIVQGITQLPMQTFGFEDITYVFMSHGGIIMRDGGSNVLLLVEATTSAAHPV